MLLPQSSAFAALKNRLNSVSSICNLQTSPRLPNTASLPDRQVRQSRGREDGSIRWADLLEKFRTVQEKARRTQRFGGDKDPAPREEDVESRGDEKPVRPMKDAIKQPYHPPSVAAKDPITSQSTSGRKLGLSRQLGRLGGAVAAKGKRGA
jgi:vacuole morphology and inheritance protein 14